MPVVYYHHALFETLMEMKRAEAAHNEQMRLLNGAWVPTLTNPGIKRLAETCAINCRLDANRAATNAAMQAEDSIRIAIENQEAMAAKTRAEVARLVEYPNGRLRNRVCTPMTSMRMTQISSHMGFLGGYRLAIEHAAKGTVQSLPTLLQEHMNSIPVDTSLVTEVVGECIDEAGLWKPVPNTWFKHIEPAPSSPVYDSSSPVYEPVSPPIYNGTTCVFCTSEVTCTRLGCPCLNDIQDGGNTNSDSETSARTKQTARTGTRGTKAPKAPRQSLATMADKTREERKDRDADLVASLWCGRDESPEPGPYKAPTESHVEKSMRLRQESIRNDGTPPRKRMRPIKDEPTEPMSPLVLGVPAKPPSCDNPDCPNKAGYEPYQCLTCDVNFRAHARAIGE